MSSPVLENGRVVDGLSFRHLQMPPAYVRDLERLGLRCVGDLADSAVPKLQGYEAIARIAIRRAKLVARHSSGSVIDWSGFWNEPPIRLYWMAMSFEEGAFEKKILELPLSSLSGDFGALLNIPQALGLQTLGDIISVYEEGSTPWRGFGASKVARLGAQLQEIAEHRTVLSVQSSSADGATAPSLPPDVLTWNIGALGLGAGALKLSRNGYDTLASLQVEQSVLFRLPGVGRSTISLARDRLALLAEAITDDAVNLERLAELEGVGIIPESEGLEDGQLFDCISSVLRSLAEADGSEAALPILERRICTGGSDEATLDEIAGTLPSRITRERVRQIERRILQKAATLLLSPFPVMGYAVVRPVLRDKFRDLAAALEGRELISPEELALLISEEWCCSLAEAVSVLPMVMAVIEGTARTFAELRRLVDSPAFLLQPLDRVAGRWPAQNVGAERGLARKLEELAIRNLEDLRLAWIGGNDFGHHQEYVQTVLDAVGTKSADEETFASRLGERTDKRVVPGQVKGWSDYFGSICEDVATIIDTGTFRLDAERIFRQRTSALANERITLEALGGKLGRLGVTVKQTETDTLARLASTILEGQGGYAQCILRPDWLALWKDLKKIHERFPDDQKTFRRSIEELYGIEEEALTMAMPVIWAILTGLLTRQSYGRARTDIGRNTSVLAPVKLAGFRSIH